MFRFTRMLAVTAHFTGSNVKNILRGYEIPMDNPVFYSDISSAYAYLFKEMINELQTCRTGFEELLAMYLRQIFLLVQRTRQEQPPVPQTERYVPLPVLQTDVPTDSPGSGLASAHSSLNKF